MTNLLSLGYWFSLQPPEFISLTSRILLIIFIVLFTVGIFVKIYSATKKLEKMTRRAIERIGNCLLGMGLSGLALYFFAYERIPILSMRILYIIWLAGFILWIWLIYKFIKVEMSKKIAQKQEREQADKWLPKPKKQ